MGIRPLCFLLAVAVVVSAYGGDGAKPHQAHPAEQAQDGSFYIGAGKGDITPWIAEIGFMGYAMFQQKGAGILMRMWARAFIVEDASSGQRFAFVSMDACMAMSSVTRGVLKALQKKYNDTYSYNNVILSGTHTHSGPGGYSEDILYQISTLGFETTCFDALVDGVVTAIDRAHAVLESNKAAKAAASIYMATGSLTNSSINRSPPAYANNPASERARYKYNTDKEMLLLRMTDGSTEYGMINWFAVHGTSLNNTNRLVASDNKGLACVRFEDRMNKSPLPGLVGAAGYVAAFAQSNEGDVSPNTRGPSCEDGSPCDYLTSTCYDPTKKKNSTLLCTAKGPGKDMYESNSIIANLQLEEAQKLFDMAPSAGTALQQGIDFRHQFVDMSSVQVSERWSENGTAGSTCRPALGFSFAGGTIDGPGDFPFSQGATNESEFWRIVSGFIAKPTPEQIACQHPKPILIDVGMTKPIPWVATTVGVQVTRVGQLWIIALPGEFTTMAGRHLRETLAAHLESLGVQSPTVVIAGLSNHYTHYITTFDEYQIQRYEGASTLYGPYTLSAYVQVCAGLVEAIVNGSSVDPGPTPPDESNHTFNLIPGVVYDSHPLGKHFGDQESAPASSYTAGSMASATFWGADPRNNLRTESTFMSVEWLNGTTWSAVYNDGAECTRFHWERHGLAESLVTLEWYIPENQRPGQYRFHVYGDSKSLLGKITPYDGVSTDFTVTQ